MSVVNNAKYYPVFQHDMNTKGKVITSCVLIRENGTIAAYGCSICGDSEKRYDRKEGNKIAFLRAVHALRKGTHREFKSVNKYLHDSNRYGCVDAYRSNPGEEYFSGNLHRLWTQAQTFKPSEKKPHIAVVNVGFNNVLVFRNMEGSRLPFLSIQ